MGCFDRLVQALPDLAPPSQRAATQLLEDMVLGGEVHAVHRLQTLTRLLRLTQLAEPTDATSLAIVRFCTRVAAHGPTRDSLYQAELATVLLHFLHRFRALPPPALDWDLVAAVFQCLDAVLEITDDLVADFVARGGVRCLCRAVHSPLREFRAHASRVLRVLITRPRLPFRAAATTSPHRALDAFEFFVDELQRSPETPSYAQVSPSLPSHRGGWRTSAARLSWLDALGAPRSEPRTAPRAT